MKVFGRNSLSSVLYWLFILCLIIVVVLLFSQIATFYNSNQPMLEYNNNTPFILMSFLTISPKIITFYLLIMIFKSFKSDVIFTARTLKYLNIFTIFSLCMPVLYALLNYFSLNTEIMLVVNNMFTNLMLGVFSAFIAAIFKKGIHLREENNLTI